MQQDKTPLFDGITEYIQTDPAYFRIPGHRLEKGISRKWTDLVGSKIFAYDVTETPATDDLHHPEGIIKEAQELAADLFGAKKSFFLVNGTTCGNEAMILTAAHQGEKIMIARNAHKSAMMGLIMSGAEPVYVMPEICHSYGIQGGITPEAVEQTFQKEPDCKALFLVSPSYYGICSDLKRIAEVCHRHNALLLVDEAHGGHLYFRDGEYMETEIQTKVSFPMGALEQGADMCVQSMHKITGALGQSSILHVGTDRVNVDKVAANLQIVQSTSPSYLLMTSLDLARFELAMHGADMNQKALKMAEQVREQLLLIPGVDCMGTEVIGTCGVQNLDRTRLTISAKRLGISGYELDNILFNQYHVDMELSDQENVLAIFTYANCEEDGQRLVTAMQKIADARQRLQTGVSEREDKRMDTGIQEESELEEIDIGIQGRCGLTEMMSKEQPIVNLDFPAIPAQVLTPREAYFAEKQTIRWKDAIGMTTAEMLAPYPPGIPVIYPGELITEEIWTYMDTYRAGGHPMHGPADDTLETIQIVKNR